MKKNEIRVAKTRLADLFNAGYDPRACLFCSGTGIVRGKRRGSRGSGCAQCLVRCARTSVSTEDFYWLLLMAGENVQATIARKGRGK